MERQGKFAGFGAGLGLSSLASSATYSLGGFELAIHGPGAPVSSSDSEIKK